MADGPMAEFHCNLISTLILLQLFNGMVLKIVAEMSDFHLVSIFFQDIL